MAYDPQRSRHRPEPTPDEPAPVDALLDAAPVVAESALPEGVAIDVTEQGTITIHTADAEVEMSAGGDDVIVRTEDAMVEVRPEADDVLVRSGGDDVVVDTSPWDGDDLDAVLGAEIDASRRARWVRLVAATLLAGLVAALVTSRWRRRRALR